MLETAAKNVPNKTLNTGLGPGMFAANEPQRAKLRFSPEHARRIGAEHMFLRYIDRFSVI
ncbi:hypothetical protein [Aromatoleum bremense]|uniref:Uncharacterized protein n=1 Tax=Aromatoleum bremense TaxID=76115 RepID=A0ABX1P0Q2_9RHOO|nr:hypothetical protein [Aromatoleum bremense]NMG17371.1 hypothetical protein [Aromatoleum bremense]QTQ31972.1 Uncharacterized protein pbN1_19820 [Aromatoleum bremense]